MDCEITATPEFNSNLKRLGKKYKSLKIDFAAFIESLRENPLQGSDLSGGVRKIRFAIRSKGKGKRGGARVITCNTLVSEDCTKILLVIIYDKSEQESITDKEIKDIIRDYYM